MGAGESFPGIKLTTDRQLEVKKTWLYKSTPFYAFMAKRFVRDNFYL
jgi:hypothetical protein